MSSPLLPGTPVQTQIWKMEAGKAYFRFVDQNTGKAVLLSLIHIFYSRYLCR